MDKNFSSDADFAKEIELHPQVFSDIRKGKLYIGAENISILLERYKNTDAVWILTGQITSERLSIVAEPEAVYSDKDRYVSRLVRENERLIADKEQLNRENLKKQEIIDGFMQGNIVVKKNKSHLYRVALKLGDYTPIYDANIRLSI